MTLEQRNAANFDLPIDAYSDANDIASDIPTRKPHAAPTTPRSQSDDRTRGWSSALSPPDARGGMANPLASRTAIEPQRNRACLDCSCNAGNKEGTHRESGCAEVVGPEGAMTLLGLVRGISEVVAHSTAMRGGAEYPTARWQDKSRRLRVGRAVEECRHIRHFARGATEQDRAARPHNTLEIHDCAHLAHDPAIRLQPVFFDLRDIRVVQVIRGGREAGGGTALRSRSIDSQTALARIFSCAVCKSVRQREEGVPGAGPPRYGAFRCPRPLPTF